MAEPILYAFVDNSNVLIEAQRFAQMKRKGKSKLSAFTDDSYEIDWGKFLYLLKEQDQRGFGEVPILYGSRPPEQDSVWQRIRDDGLDVKLFDRNIRNKEKGVDMEMGMDIAELIHVVSPPKTSWRLVTPISSQRSTAPGARDGQSRCGSEVTLLTC